MGCVSTAAHVGGSQVLGIIPQALAKGNFAGKIVGEKLRVPTMKDKIWKMLDNSDAFITSPGARQIFISASTTEEMIDKLEDFVYKPDPIAVQIDCSKGSGNKKHKLDLSLHL
ncbi:hypothetical protein DITRI_Ditri04bG0074200 [Diplodiscus trichospermus]